MNATILSPLTFSTNVKEIEKIKISKILEIYSRDFNIDLKTFFNELTEVTIFRCLDTQYMFYFPFNIQGDDKYYEAMGKFEWYYNPSRWEHTKALEIINNTGKVLEVGSGSGFFLKELSKKNSSFVGLELNEKAIDQAKNIGIDLQKEYVEDHAKSHNNIYDFVCSFQVLEHISQPHQFLAAQIKCIKSKGKLIIGVPNNDSYMKNVRFSDRVLNMPPHHMGLWTLDSLKSLETIFDITLKEVYYEPLVGGNINVYLWNRITRFFFGFSIFTRIIWKLKLNIFLRFLLVKMAGKIKGNSMLVVFEVN